MPLYEYRCHSCGARFERLIRSTAATATTVDAHAPRQALVCPRCDSTEVERLLSIFARTTAACAPTPSGGG